VRQKGLSQGVGLWHSTEEASNVRGGKAITLQQLDKGNICHTGGGTGMETRFEQIAEVGRNHPREKLTTLVHYINADTLNKSFQRLNGKKAVGVDEVTKEVYGEELARNIEQLVEKMKRQAYKPQPVKRVYIPKDGTDELRPLGLPALEDKIVQDVISGILEEIYEPIFLDMSYGFRPRRDCHDALRKLNSIIEDKKVNYIVDADIKGFFNNVDHEWLMKMLENRIGDPNLLRLINRFLKAGIIEEGRWEESEVGTPQGGLISPILANIYLHYAVDLWFEKIVKKQSKGEAYMVRYADDFVCCFQYRDDAERFYAELKERLGKFKLQIATEKSKIIEFGRFAETNLGRRGEKPETFDFLGFTHYCGKSKVGKFRVKRVTSKKKLKSKLKQVKQWLRESISTPIVDVIKELNVKLRGHYNYYGITDNSPGIKKYAYVARRALYRHINRRRQGHPCDFLKFEKLLMKYPLVPALIKLSIYAEGS
jgi:group II intron reverse transcriptase/maturase